MNTTFELIWATLTNPKGAFKKIREEKPLYAALIFLLIYGIVTVVVSRVAGKSNLNTLSQIPNNEIAPYLKDFAKNFGTFINNYLSSTLFFVFGLIIPYLSTFIFASIYDLIAQFTVKKGNGIALFIAWSFAAMPMLVYKILYLVIFVTLNYALPAYIELIFIVWGIYMYVTAIREIYKINTGVAIGIYFIPFIVAFALIIIYVSLLLPLLSGILPSIPGVP